MATYYITKTGLAQGDLVNFLKDVETAMGGTNTTNSIATVTTPIGSNAKSVALSYATSMVITPASVINSVWSAGSIMASGISVAVASSHTGELMSLWSRINSRLTSHSL